MPRTSKHLERDADFAFAPAVPGSEALREKVARIYQLLVETYGIPPWEPDGDALGELIATVLSQHTSDVNSERAYANLKQAFSTWEAVRDAPVDAVAEAIRSGGLARQKAPRIQEILGALTKRSPGEQLSLNRLRAMPMDEALSYLQGFPGVGPKTAACVLLFALGRPVFPVDTHIWRVTRRLGLIGAHSTADAAHTELTALIPPEWRHTMHVDLIRHGRDICHAQRPECPRCPLRAECQYYWEVVATER
ncbi:MAG TPA: endonuclease III [Ktedonobacterales bacterium]|jgi:endonuclease-3|nr:endonuclease III [Ktedonobacterales bacterium]